MQRNTVQRRVILTTLHTAPGPLTAQEVHLRAQRVHAGIGLATVYRNLNRLADEGGVVEVHLPGETTRFEPAGRGHHHHFRCRSCERVFELTSSCPVSPLEGVTLPGGFRVEHHDLTLYGLCASCQS